MTITRALRYLVVSALLLVGGAAFILPVQAVELAPEDDTVENVVGVEGTVEENAETDEDTATDTETSDSDEPIQYSDGEEPYATGVMEDDDFFPEIDVTTNYDATESVAYGGVKFVAGETLSIEQEKAVDIFAAASSIVLEEPLTGDLFAAAEILNVNAFVAGSVRAAGATVNINAEIERNLLLFAETVYIGEDAIINGHANIYAGTVVIEGNIEQNIQIFAENVTVNGALKGTSNIEGEDVYIGANALIGTGGTIKTPYIPKVHTDAIGAELFTLEQTDYSDYEETFSDKTDRLLERVQKWTLSFFFFLIVGGLMIILWPNWTKNVSTTMEEEFGQSAQKGLVFIFLVPLALIAVSLTLILLPFAFFAGPLYILAVVLARVFVGMLLGRHIVNKKFKEEKKQRLLEYLVGYFIVSVLLSLPLIGWFICMLAGAWGMGGVLQDFSNHHSKKKSKKKAAPKKAPAKKAAPKKVAKKTATKAKKK